MGICIEVRATAFLQFFENKVFKEQVLVFVHPAWPWPFFVQAKNSRRMRTYLQIVERALAFEGRTIVVGDAQGMPEGPWSKNVLALIAKARAIIPSSSETDFSREAQEIVKLVNPHTSIVLAGFYRNLCVRQLGQHLKAANMPFTVAPEMSPIRLV